jgi:hypothetical protein
MGLGGQGHVRAALPTGKTQYPLYRKLGGPPGPVWTGVEKSRPHQDSIPGLSSPLHITIRTALSGPTYICLLPFLITYLTHLA